ncbi:uncharacterized protein LOC115710806 [Cannabis sativa]|uniref:uncharacterized protein LOC115710806 n=1 Tax=Cannabis sativa TaxID=3483 RepID=UPI0029C9FFC0|nr:uncharacterized protein LOC115710806 [Cannabis sativa]
MADDVPTHDCSGDENSGDENLGYCLQPPNHRGPTRMKRICQRMDKGEKIDLEVNDKGEYFGDMYGEMISWLGVRCRQTIGINYKDWRYVDQSLKDKIWKDVQRGFNVRADWKKDCLKIAGRIMKDFKTKMTCDVIMPLAKENKVKELAIPPKNHPEIDQEDWVKFVASRLTPEHMALRKAQSDRACQNTSRHHSARRGMVTLREDVKKEIKIQDPARHHVWLKSRKKNNVLVTDLDREIAARIAELEEKVNSGEVLASGRNDILTQALGTPEHPGRVRAAGYATFLI